MRGSQQYANWPLTVAGNVADQLGRDSGSERVAVDDDVWPAVGAPLDQPFEGSLKFNISYFKSNMQQILIMPGRPRPELSPRGGRGRCSVRSRGSRRRGRGGRTAGRSCRARGGGAG